MLSGSRVMGGGSVASGGGMARAGGMMRRGLGCRLRGGRGLIVSVLPVYETPVDSDDTETHITIGEKIEKPRGEVKPPRSVLCASYTLSKTAKITTVSDRYSRGCNIL